MLILELWSDVTWSQRAAEADLERIYRDAEDPWDYASSPEEVDRHARALEMVVEAASGRSVQALEVGCSEGLLTKRLAVVCDSVLAVDVSAVALDRARRRCANEANVRFRRWRLPSTPLPGRFDVVVCLDTLVCLPPLRRRRAIATLSEMVLPGGHLVVGEPLAPALIEDSGWGRVLLLGATHLVDRFGSKAGMQLRRKESTGKHIVASYGQPAGPAPKG